MEINKNKGIIIGGYKAVGKSTLAKKYENVIDLETSDYEYIIDSELKKIPIEERKGLKSRKPNPDYPLNYYNAILEHQKDNKIVLFGCKKEVVELLDKNNIDYYIVYPEENMLDEIVDRCRLRKNNEHFLSRIKEVYYSDYPKENKNVLWLKKGEYLEDLLLRHKLL